MPDRETAEILVKEWLNFCKGLDGPYSQNIKKVNDLEHDLVEIIKYNTKIFTDPEMRKGKNTKKDFKIYASAIENTIYALGRTRRHCHFGIKLSKIRKPAKETDLVENVTKYKFDKFKNNWVNIKNADLTIVPNQFDRTKINALNSNLNAEAE